MVVKVKSIFIPFVFLLIFARGTSDQVNPLSDTGQAETFINSFFKCIIQARSFPQRELSTTIENLKKTLLSSWNSRITAEMKSKATTVAFTTSLASLMKNGASIPVKKRVLQQCLQTASMETQGVVNKDFMQEIMKMVDALQEKQRTINSQNMATFGALNEIQPKSEFSSNFQSVPDVMVQMNNPQKKDFGSFIEVSNKLDFSEDFNPKLESTSPMIPQTEMTYSSQPELISRNFDLRRNFQQPFQSSIPFGEPQSGGLQMSKDMFSTSYDLTNSYQTPFLSSSTNDIKNTYGSFGDSFSQNKGSPNAFQFPSAQNLMFNQQGSSFRSFNEPFLRNTDITSNFQSFPDVTSNNQRGTFNLPSETFRQNSGVSGSFGLSFGIRNTDQLNGGRQTTSDSFSRNFGLPNYDFLPSSSSFGFSGLNKTPSSNLGNPTFENFLSNKLRFNKVFQEVFSRKVNKAIANQYASSIAEAMAKKFYLPNTYMAQDFYRNVFQNVPEYATINDYISTLVSGTVKLLSNNNILNVYNAAENANLAATAISNGISSYRNKLNYDNSQNQILWNQQSDFSPGLKNDWSNSQINFNSKFSFGSDSRHNDYPIKTFEAKNPTDVKASFKNSLFSSIIVNDSFITFIQNVSKEKANLFSLQVAKNLENKFGFQSNDLANKMQSMLMSSEYPLNSYLTADSIASIISDSLKDNNLLSFELLTRNVDDAKTAIISATALTLKEESTSTNATEKTGDPNKIPEDSSKLQSSRFLQFQKSLYKALQSDNTFSSAFEKSLTTEELQKTARAMANAICKALHISDIKSFEEKLTEALQNISIAGNLDSYTKVIAQQTSEILHKTDESLDLDPDKTTIKVANAITNAFTNLAAIVLADKVESGTSADTLAKVKEQLLAKINEMGTMNSISKEQLKQKNIQNMSQLFCQLLSKGLQKEINTTMVNSFNKDLNDILNDNLNLPLGFASAITKLLSSQGNILSSDLEGIVDISVNSLSECLSKTLNVKPSSEKGTNTKKGKDDDSGDTAKDAISENFKKEFKNLLKNKILVSGLLKAKIDNKTSETYVLKMSKIYWQLLLDEFKLKNDLNANKPFTDNLLGIDFKSGDEKIADIMAEVTGEILNSQGKLKEINLEDTASRAFKCFVSSMSKAQNIGMKNRVEPMNTSIEINGTQDASSEISKENSKVVRLDVITQDSSGQDLPLQEEELEAKSEKPLNTVKDDANSVKQIDNIKTSLNEDIVGANTGVDSKKENGVAVKQIDNIKTSLNEDIVGANTGVDSKKENGVKGDRGKNTEVNKELKDKSQDGMMDEKETTNFAHKLKINILERGVLNILQNEKLSKESLTKLASTFTKLLCDKFQLQIDNDLTESIKTSFLEAKMTESDLGEKFANTAAAVLINGDSNLSNLDNIIDTVMQCISLSISELLKMDKNEPLNQSKGLVSSEDSAVMQKELNTKEEGSFATRYDNDQRDKNNENSIKTDAAEDVSLASGTNINLNQGDTGINSIFTNSAIENGASMTKDTIGNSNVIKLEKSGASQELSLEKDFKLKFITLLNGKLHATELLDAILQKELNPNDITTFIKSYFKLLSDKFQVQADKVIVKSLYEGLINQILNPKPEDLATVISSITADFLISQNKSVMKDVDVTSDEVLQCILKSWSTLDINLKEKTQKIATVNTNIDGNMSIDLENRPNMNFDEMQNEFIVPDTNTESKFKKPAIDRNILQVSNLESNFKKEDIKNSSINLDKNNKTAIISESKLNLGLDMDFKNAKTGETLIGLIPPGINLNKFEKLNSNTNQKLDTNLAANIKIPDSKIDLLEPTLNVKNKFLLMLKKKILGTDILDEVVKKQLKQKDIISLAKIYCKLLSEKLKIQIDINKVKSFYNGFLKASTENSVEKFANIFAEVTGDILMQQGILDLSNLESNLKSVLETVLLSISQSLSIILDKSSTISDITAEKPEANSKISNTMEVLRNGEKPAKKIDLKAKFTKLLELKILSTGILDTVAEKQISQQNIIALTKNFFHLLSEKLQIQVNPEMIKLLFKVFSNIGNKSKTKEFASQFSNAITDILANQGKINFQNMDSLNNITVQCILVSISKSLGLNLNINDALSTISRIKLDLDDDIPTDFRNNLENLTRKKDTDIKNKFINLLKAKILATKGLDSVVKKLVTQNEVAELSKLYSKLLSEKFKVQINSNMVKVLYLGLMRGVINANESDLADTFISITANTLFDQDKLTVANIDKSADNALSIILLCLSQSLNININNEGALVAPSSVNVDTDFKITKELKPDLKMNIDGLSDTIKQMSSDNSSDLKVEFASQLKSKILSEKVLEAIIKKEPTRQDIAAFSELYCKSLSDKMQLQVNIDIVKNFYNGFLKAEKNYKSYASVLADITADWLNREGKLNPGTMDATLQETLKCGLLSASKAFNLNLDTNVEIAASKTSSNIDDIFDDIVKVEDNFDLSNLGNKELINFLSKNDLKMKFFNMLKGNIKANKNIDTTMIKYLSSQDIAEVSKKYCRQLNEKLQVQTNDDTIRSLFIKLSNARNNVQADYDDIFANFTTDLLQQQGNLNSTNLNLILDTVVQSIISSLPQNKDKSQSLENIPEISILNEDAINNDSFFKDMYEENFDSSFLGKFNDMTDKKVSNADLSIPTDFGQNLNRFDLKVPEIAINIPNFDFNTGFNDKMNTEFDFKKTEIQKTSSSDFLNYDFNTAFDDQTLEIKRKNNSNFGTEEAFPEQANIKNIDFVKQDLKNTKNVGILDDNESKTNKSNTNEENIKTSVNNSKEEKNEELATEITTKNDKNKLVKDISNNNSRTLKMEETEKVTTGENSTAELENKIKLKFAKDFGKTLASSEDFRLSALSGDLEDIVEAITATLEAICGSDISKEFSNAFGTLFKG